MQAAAAAALSSSRDLSAKSACSGSLTPGTNISDSINTATMSAVATIVVSRWEGELDRAQLNAALNGASSAPAEAPALAAAE